MTRPTYIVDIFGDIVSNAMAAVQKEPVYGLRPNGLTLLQTLQATETLALDTPSKIETIDYQYGHILELIETLKQMEDPDNRKLKYPLVYLVQDFSEDRGKSVGIYAESSLRLIIAHHTEVNFKIEQRYDKVFKPVLYPIYYEVLNQIALHPLIMVSDADTIPHVKTDRSYWGKTSGGGNSENTLNDYVDAIEITQLKLSFYFKTC